MKEFKDKYKLKNKEHKNTFTLKELIFITGIFGLVVCIFTGVLVFTITNNGIFDKNLNDIIKSYKEITNTYYKKIDNKSLAASAIDGMYEFLGNKYSKHLDSEETTKMIDSLSNSYKGIGIQVYSDGNNYIIYDVIKNSESSKAGLKKNDILRKINDTNITKDISSEDIANLINSSNKVHLIVERDSKELSFDIEVKNVVIPIVDSSLYKKNNKQIGYISISTFSKDSYSLFKEELELLEHRSIDSLIIDLRGNGGGYLSSAEEIADLFIKKGKTIYTLEFKDSKKEAIAKEDTYRTYPIVVLIDEGTASASEVLALALKESYGATLIGEQSHGKAEVQLASTLSDDTMIKSTVANWYSPNHNNINEVGITPGIRVQQSLEYKVSGGLQGKDLQLESALEFISK